MSGPLEPFYSRHKVTELTCPHCSSILTFLVNERDHSVYSCNCGRWLKRLDATMTGTPTHWQYEPKEAYLSEKQ